MSVLLIICLCLAVSNAGAAYTTPSKVPIQGRLTNVSTGAALSGVYVFTFRVYNATTDGTKLWEESQSLTVDSGGLWSTLLGNNTPLDVNFSEDTYIEIEINHDGDPLPRVQLAAVPYSKRTDIAANLSCVDCIGGAEINESSLSGVNAAQLGGQASGYYLNTSTSFGGDVSGAYNSMEVNASKIDTGTLNRSYVEDAYLLNTGDNASGNYSFDSDTLYIDSSNRRIGIGTSTPTIKLDVQGGVNAADNLTTPMVCLGGDCRTTWPTGSSISSAGGWVNTSSETYSSLDVNLSNKFFFNSSSGNVGIGTMSPDQPLDVAGALAINYPASVTYTNWIANKGYPVIYISEYSANPYPFNLNGNLIIQPRTSAGRDIVFATNNGNTTPNASMVIQNGGNVGIGTTAPQAKLHVNVPGGGAGGDNIYDIVENGVTYRVHKFTTVGSATFTPPAGVTSVEYLIVAGGGSGKFQNSLYNGGSGGGAGGLLTGTGYPVSGSLGITVGAGGVNTSGGNSVFDTITATGGGSYMGSYSGGSGAGGDDVVYYNGGTGISGQGHDGGYSNAHSAAGGGGAGAVGNNSGGAAYPGSGGAGLSNSITGTTTYYAGGGGGGWAYYYGGGPISSGGIGGGGAGGGGPTMGAAGTDGLGGGGGGGGSGTGGSGLPGRGGNGVVIVRYLISEMTAAAIFQGNVGIGTTEPNADLHIGSGGLGYVTRNRLIIQPPQHTGGPWKFDARDDSSKSYLDIHYGTGIGMTFNSDGNVGIGTTSPGYQLTLSTNSAAKPTSDHWTISSDARLKENITEIPNALQTVLQLKGREFEYINKEQYGASRQYGFIAQDVEAVIPRWVQTGEDGYKTLTIAGDTALLVEAIKDQQGAIQDQQKQMDKLKADNEALKAEKDAEIGQLRVENSQIRKENEALKQAVCEINPNASVCAGM
jgi:hypothetical protein